MNLRIYTDGGSLGNPGPAAYAFVVYQDGQLIFYQSQTIGQATNNMAEYTALIKALEWIKKFQIKNCRLDISQIEFFSDSSLMINQINGLFKVKNPFIRQMIMKIRILEAEIKTPLIYQYIPREKNFFANSLIKKTLQNSS